MGIVYVMGETVCMPLIFQLIERREYSTIQEWRERRFRGNVVEIVQ